MLQRSRHGRVWTVVLVLACLGLVPSMAAAQGSAIGGTVTDTTAGVLPGVTVEARSPDIIEGVRTAVTDGNGQFLIIALEPGTYDVVFTLPGFNTLIREGIELSVGFRCVDLGDLRGPRQPGVAREGRAPRPR